MGASLWDYGASVEQLDRELRKRRISPEVISKKMKEEAAQLLEAAAVFGGSSFECLFTLSESLSLLLCDFPILFRIGPQLLG